MNQPWVYMCSPSRKPLPPSSPSHPLWVISLHHSTVILNVGECDGQQFVPSHFYRLLVCCWRYGHTVWLMAATTIPYLSCFTLSFGVNPRNFLHHRYPKCKPRSHTKIQFSKPHYNAQADKLARISETHTGTVLDLMPLISSWWAHEMPVHSMASAIKAWEELKGLPFLSGNIR